MHIVICACIGLGNSGQLSGSCMDAITLVRVQKSTVLHNPSPEQFKLHCMVAGFLYIVDMFSSLVLSFLIWQAFIFKKEILTVGCYGIHLEAT